MSDREIPGPGVMHHQGGGGLQHEGQLHLAGAEQLADDLHAGEEMDFDDVERRMLRERLIEVVLKALAIAVDDPVLEARLHVGGAFMFDLGLGAAPLVRDLVVAANSLLQKSYRRFRTRCTYLRGISGLRHKRPQQGRRI